MVVFCEEGDRLAAPRVLAASGSEGGDGIIYRDGNIGGGELTSYPPQYAPPPLQHVTSY